MAEVEGAHEPPLPPKASNPSPSDDSYLISQIDMSRDDYLRDASMLDDVRVKARYSGSFSSPQAQELLVVFSIDNVPHVAGLGRVILVVFDTKTRKPVAQLSQMGDRVDIHFLPSAQGSTIIFSLTTMIHQGYFSYGYVGLQLQGKEWKYIPLLDKTLLAKLMDGAMLHYKDGNLDILTQSYDENRHRSLRLLAQLVWDEKALRFMPLSPSAQAPPLRGYKDLSEEPLESLLDDREREVILQQPNSHAKEAESIRYELIEKSSHETHVLRFSYLPSVPCDDLGHIPLYKTDIITIRK